ncbi:cytochrome P450 4C1-like [Trichoplusia ni]|uniref:Cytochrome P450 4C1-like n=1 Tax=Trichoplusia ni TaxID=7111 RepID=A0A7E5VH25_TRINI|nr:cytochrome P450 4C1-like [Trichoplusia ni]
MLVEVLLAAAAVLVLWMLFKNDEDPLDKVPGPPKRPIIGNAWEIFRHPPDKFLYLLRDNWKEHGNRFVFKILGLRVLHVAGPEDIEVVLSHTKNIKKSIVYRFLKDWLGDGLLLSTGAHWHARRKILTPTFHFNILKSFSIIMEEKVQDMVEMLKTKNGEALDVMPMVSDFTLFTICETAMGTKLDSDKTSNAKDYKAAILKIGMTTLSRTTRFWLHNDTIFNLSSHGKQFAQYLETVRSFADKVIAERKEERAQKQSLQRQESVDGVGTKRRMAMLDLLLEAQEKGQIDIEGIRDEVNTFMFEGHDTTAMAITFGLMLLADHADVQERVFEEVQSILAGADRPVTLADLTEMKYMEAVIKEILRIYPSVPIIGREAVEDFKLGDLLVKKGSTIDVQIYLLHQNPELFPEPELFKPDRFLEGEARHPYAYVPFSAGPRNCIGQRFAIQEMKITLSEIVRNFKLVPKVKGFRPTLMADLVLRPVDPINVKFLSR